MARKRWGVDSAAPADAALLKCVETSYGFPSYWGRYLTETQGSVLTKKENPIFTIKGNKNSAYI